MLHAYYLFDDEASFLEAASGIPLAAGHLTAIGVLREPPLPEAPDSPGAAIPGYHVLAAWTDAEAPGFAAARRSPSEAPVWFAGVPREGPRMAVPDSVTNFQARAMLLRIGLLDEVTAAISAAGGEAWQAWEYANVVSRHGALTTAIAARFDLTEEQIDALFLEASEIAA
ncbi:hypothetical protein [Falsiroseomonas sp. CW058]|uniref:hypothetical protein n=1 Tax=Falsiroseomonas sp. CW058 TaxID=3388664 RepID=UPI003D31AE70